MNRFAKQSLEDDFVERRTGFPLGALILKQMRNLKKYQKLEEFYF